MEKLTKLKNVFSKENIKKGVVIAGLVMGLASCKDPIQYDYCDDPNCLEKGTEYVVSDGHTHDYCNEEGCVIDDTIYHTKHDYCPEDNCWEKHDEHGHDYCPEHDDCWEKHPDGKHPVKEDTTPVEPEQPEETDENECDQDGCVLENGHDGDHDYCKTCEGNQTEEHGHCDTDGCLKKGPYEGQHNHEYDQCEKCDDEKDDNTCVNGSECEHQGGNETTWFKAENIGGEDSPYKALCIDSIKYNEANPDTTEVERFNNYQNQYKSFIEGLEFSDDFIKQFPEIKNINFAEFAEYNVNDKISYKESFDQLINSINNACALVFDSVTKNIKISNDADIDKKLMLYYYNAMKNEAENGGATGGDINNANYNAKKASIDKTLQRFNTAEGTNFSIYEKTTDANGEIVYGEILPEVVDRLELMFDHAAHNLGIERTDIENTYNISLCGSSAKGLHDALSDITHEISDDCATNEMSTVISGVDPIAKAPIKLNKSIFSHDYGRELV